MSNGATVRTIARVLSVVVLPLVLLLAPAAGAQEVQSLEHDTINGTHNSLVQVDADTYALAYSGDGSDGFIKTFTISADGSTITEVQSLEHGTVFVLYSSLVQVDADTYALARSEERRVGKESRSRSSAYQ